MKIQKRLILPLCLALTCSVGFFVQAKHHQLIHPGDHVFDAKRFHDSVLETAQQALTASQTAQEMTIRILQHTGIVEPGSAVAQAMDRYENRYQGETLINPGSDLMASPIEQLQTYDSFDSTYEMNANRYLQRVHADTLKLTGDVMVQQQNREKDKADILAIEAPGRMGEIQKGSSLAILHGMDTADEARLEGAKMAQEIAEDEAKYAEMHREFEQTSSQTITVSDPYNTPMVDENGQSLIDNFGFLSTRQTE